MNTRTINPLLLTLLLLLITTLQPTTQLPTPTTLSTLLSHSHTLLTRVATLRQSRGDTLGATRAKTIAHNIDKHSHGFSFYGTVWSVGWDYLRNYAWRDVGMVSVEMVGVVKDMNELSRGLSELTRLENEVERVDWVRRNYGGLLKVAKSLVSRLLKVFSHSGPLKDAVEMVRTEIVDGGLLQDCLELGSGDMKGVIRILKDLALQYASTNSKTEL